MGRRRRRNLWLALVMAGWIGLPLAAGAGCTVKTVSSPKGCETRVAAVKIGPCRRCVTRGPRWHYKPLQPPGTRCVKR